MKHVAQTFRAEHRIRLALSTSYFPIAWPAPEAVELQVLTDQSMLALPLRDGDHSEAASFAPPRAGVPLEQAVETPPTAE